MPSGNEIVLCWVALLCLASKSKRPGVILINDTVVQSEDVLSMEARVSVEVAKLALATFSKYGMIGVDDETGSVEITRFAEHQDLERLEYFRERERVRKAEYRKKTRELQGRADVPRLSHGTGRDVPGESAHKTRLDKIRLDKTREEKSVTRNETRNEDQRGAVAPPAPPVIIEGKPKRVKKDSPKSELFDRLVEMRQTSETMPISGQDERELFSHQARVMLADIEQREGLEQATAVFDWAFRDKFWSKMPVVPRNYLKYKTAMGEGKKGDAGQFARVMAMIEKERGAKNGTN